MSHPDNIAIDEDGEILPFTPEQVSAITTKALDEGDILAGIVKMPNGDIAFHVFGPPSRDVLDALERGTAAYRRMLTGAKGPQA